MFSETYPLSVVVATTHPWPAARACLEILAPQVAAAGGELLLAKSRGDGFPTHPPAELSGVRCLHLPGASVFELRAAATTAARGALIAWTEDHCRPAPDWCTRILASHAGHPRALALGGAVINGSTDSLMDWANFLITFGPFLPGMERSKMVRAPAAANVAFVRSALPAEGVEGGEIEFGLGGQFRDAGRVVYDSRQVVSHIQSWGFLEAFRIHFHNGRSTSGLASARLSLRERMGRVMSCAALPAVIVRSATKHLPGKKEVPWVRALPLIAALAFCHTAGEFAGLLTRSAGASPQLLE